jgi:hypothetical protein
LEKSLWRKEGHGFSCAVSTAYKWGLYRLQKNSVLYVPAPDFSPGERVFNPRKHSIYKLRALALVAASQAVCDFSAASLAPEGIFLLAHKRILRTESTYLSG